MIKEEKWRLVPGYDDVFASSLGRIRRINPQTKRWLVGKGIPHDEGYLRMHFHGKRWRVHRLIALAFLPNPQKHKEVNHKNGIKGDNRPSNLEWCSPSHNVRHAFRTGLKISVKGERHGRAKLTTKIVRRIFRDVHLKRIKGVEAMARYRISRPTLSAIIHGYGWTHLKMVAPCARLSGGQPAIDI